MSLPRILLIDMNSFFASVEQQANPSLRNQPVGVAVSMHPSSCLVAASKEAKLMGIKTGTVIRKAKEICPKIILVAVEPEKYREVNRAVNRIFLDYSPLVERYSIDESFLDLRESKVNPIKVAVEIKRRIKDEVGDWLTCSAGLGNNRFLAKLASGMMKPDGLSVVFKDNLRQAYEGLKLSDLWGIARGWTARLGRLGITTPVELMDYPVQNLVSLFGKSGFYIWRRVCGLEEDSMSADEQPPKSFGNSWVLDFRTTDKSRIMPVIMYLAEKAARRMRKEGFCARGIYLVIDCGGGKFGFAKSKRLGFLVESGQQFYEQANLLLAGWRPDAEVKRIAAGFMMLKQRASQLDMFGDGQRRLLEAMDFVNDRYGEFFVRSGFLARCSDFAPDSIAFGK